MLSKKVEWTEKRVKWGRGGKGAGGRAGGVGGAGVIGAMGPLATVIVLRHTLALVANWL